MRKNRVYFKVKIPQVIPSSTQRTLYRCMENTMIIIAPFLTPATMAGLPAAIPAAIESATKVFLAYVVLDTKIYPHMNKIPITIKTDKNA